MSRVRALALVGLFASTSRAEPCEVGGGLYGTGALAVGPVRTFGPSEMQLWLAVQISAGFAENLCIGIERAMRFQIGLTASFGTLQEQAVGAEGLVMFELAPQMYLGPSVVMMERTYLGSSDSAYQRPWIAAVGPRFQVGAVVLGADALYYQRATRGFDAEGYGIVFSIGTMRLVTWSSPKIRTP